MPVQRYINVILPLKLEWEPFYILPESDRDAVTGDRVLVPFAGRRYIGVVSGAGVTPPSSIGRIVEAYGIDDSRDRILLSEIQFWRRVAEYYMCSVGEVYKAAYPAVKDEIVSPRVSKATDADAEVRSTGDVSGNVPSGAGEMLDAALSSGRPVLLGGDADEELLVAKVLEKSSEKNVLWLVPEIRSAKLLERKLRKCLGSRLLVWGSNITPARKREVGRRVRSGERYVVMGTRSALFLPHSDLGLIVVQNEQDGAYKQTSPAPRYNARDCAVLLASLCGAGVILQSRAPSLESLHNVMTGKYADGRFRRSGTLPSLEVIDTGAELRKRGMNGDIPLKLMEMSCGKPMLVYKPRRAAFPKSAELVEQFGNLGRKVVAVEEPDEIPEGTVFDMLAVFGTDSLLGRQDFRADERALQLLSEALDRFSLLNATAWKAVIMTREPSHPVLRSLAASDMMPLLEERKEYAYPPFTRIVDIQAKDTSPQRMYNMLGLLEQEISASGLGKTMLLPSSVRVLFARDRRLVPGKKSLAALVASFEKKYKYGGRLFFDVDP